MTKDLGDPTDLAESIAVGPDGKVHVSDSGNKRVQVFLPDGSFIRQFGSDYMGSGQFLLPFELAVDSSGDVYVSDVGRSVLEKYSPTGAFEWAVGNGNGSTVPDLVGGELHLEGVDTMVGSSWRRLIHTGLFTSIRTAARSMPLTRQAVQPRAGALQRHR